MMETLIGFGVCFAAGIASGPFVIKRILKSCGYFAFETAMRLPSSVKIPFLRFFSKSDALKDSLEFDMWITESGRREFQYTAFGKKYIVSCRADKTNRKPCNIVSAIITRKNGTLCEVTQDVEQRMGPQGDCHGIGEITIDWFDDAQRLFVETLDSEFTITRPID
jgi:hypothetical protein